MTDKEKLSAIKAELERRIKLECDSQHPFEVSKICAYNDILDFINSLPQEQEDMGEVSDGYHTFNELYYYRMLYNAAFFNLLPKYMVHKSKKHHDGEECFGGGWFIVMANLPTGQVSNHYELKDWDLFQIPEKEIADEWDGHTPQEAAERLKKYLEISQEQISDDLEQASKDYAYTYWEDDKYHEGASEGKPFDPIGYTQKVFKAGANWQKEQMMKDAVEVEVKYDFEGLPFIYLPNYDPLDDNLLEGVEKVKVIIIKN